MMNVLLVDDEPWVLEGLQVMVNWKKYGFKVCGAAANGNSAWSMIAKYQPDLVFTDIHMPKVSGLELIDRSRHELAKPPHFVILSGHDNFEYARMAMKQRVDNYLLKPIDEDEIEVILEQLSRKIRAESDTGELYSSQHALYVNNLINRLLQGEDNHDLQVEVEKLLKIGSTGEVGCLFVETELEQQYIIRSLQQLAGADLPQIFTDSEGRVGLIAAGTPASLEQLKELGSKLYRECSSGASMVLAFGATDGGAAAIRSVYNQALQALEWKRYHMGSGIMDIHDLPPNKGMRKVNKKALAALMDILCADHEKFDFASSIEELLADPLSGLPASDMEYVRLQLLALEMDVLKRLKELEGDIDHFRQEQAQSQGRLTEINCYSAFREYGLALCSRAMAVLREQRKQNECNTMFQVVQYVNQAFREQLQLQKLAQQFHMNSNYLGQLFKQQTGKPFREYLNDKRMEEAKRLLRQGGLSVTEVAAQSGYLNSDYFVSQFKRMTGVSPAAFRKQGYK